MQAADHSYSRSFAWRRIHSLLGLLIVLFLTEHLLTNSQSALLVGENGAGYVRAVNFIKNLPYLPVIEIVLIGIPILVHGYLGVRYAISGKMNSFGSMGDKPSLGKYCRNQAYSWQRLTSWLLIVGIVVHVGYLRFYKYPIHVDEGTKQFYMTRIAMDKGLYTVSDKLGVALFNESRIKQYRAEVETVRSENYSLYTQGSDLLKEVPPDTIQYSVSQDKTLGVYLKIKDQMKFLKGLEKKPLRPGEVIAVADNFGAATLLNVRDSFKSVTVSILYTIFVLAACFHSYNGLWTFMITWGVVLRMNSQKKAVKVCYGIMALVALLGLASIWATFWINLRY